MLEWFASVDFVRIVMLVLATSALVVAIKVNIGNRSIFSPKLSWGFQPIYRAFPSVSKKLLAKDPIATFMIHTSGQKKGAAILLWIRNDSRRKFSDIKLELMYPKSYYIKNEDVEKVNDEVIESFPEFFTDAKSINKIISKRDAISYDDMIHVYYDIGTLRPGEHYMVFEGMNVPTPDKAFLDSRFESRFFGEILENLATYDVYSGVCHVRARLLSDLAKPSSKWINAVSVAPGVAVGDDTYLKSYVDAHWLGERTAGATYFKAKLPWIKHTLIVEQPVITILTELVREFKTESDKVVIFTRMEDAKTQFAFSTLLMPGYDYFILPRGIGIDAAVRSEGYRCVRSSQAS
jgi:hypothetical protein